MTDKSMAKVFCATVIQTPAPNEVEVIKDALINVGADGMIISVTEPAAAPYRERMQAAREAGNLSVLAAGKYLLPGLVDLHIHAPQWPQLGKALHLPLYEWLEQETFPLEARYADTAFARTVYESLVSNLISNGTTTAVYFGSIHSEANKVLAETCLRHGQRALVGKVAMDHPEQCPDYYCDPSAEAAIEQTAELITHVRALSGNDRQLVRPIITPRFIPSCSDALLEGLGELAASSDCHIQTHCSESDWEHNHVLARLGKTDTTALNDFGLLTRHTVLAHSNFITRDDLNIIAETRTGIAHCPLSNFHFANSIFPLRTALDKGLRVGLGTDISGGPSASMFDSCRYAITASRALEDGVNPSLAPEIRGLRGSRIDFRHAFWLATAGGGEVLDMPIGKIAPGFQFDAISVDAGADGSNITVWDGIDNGIDVLQKIVFGATRTNISDVWIAGIKVSIH